MLNKYEVLDCIYKQLTYIQSCWLVMKFKNYINYLILNHINIRDKEKISKQPQDSNLSFPNNSKESLRKERIMSSLASLYSLLIDQVYLLSFSSVVPKRLQKLYKPMSFLKPLVKPSDVSMDLSRVQFFFYW